MAYLFYFISCTLLVDICIFPRVVWLDNIGTWETHHFHFSKERQVMIFHHNIMTQGACGSWLTAWQQAWRCTISSAISGSVIHVTVLRCHIVYTNYVINYKMVSLILFVLYLNSNVTPCENNVQNPVFLLYLFYNVNP